MSSWAQRFGNLLLISLLFCSIRAVAASPKSEHVVIVVEENHRYEHIMGNTAMPFLNKLASQNGLATQYFANNHDSLPNYFWLTAGQPITFNDNTRSSFNVDNIVRYLLTAGKTWKVYAESLPSAGYVGFNVYPYVKRHNPFAYFTDVALSAQRYNIVPLTEFAIDLQNGQLPNFSFIVPNQLHNGHDGTLKTADQWLQKNIGPLFSTPAFRPGGDGVLIITYDEADDEDCRPISCETSRVEAGGRVATILAGPNIKKGYQSSRVYQHHDLLRTIGDLLRLPQVPGAAAHAQSMAEFFH